MKLTFFLLFSTAGLFGCNEKNTFDDLDAFFEQTYAKAAPLSAPSTFESDFKPLDFSPSKQSDPFGYSLATANGKIAEQACQLPDDFFKKDELEQYELSSMTFKGVLGKAGEYWALIEMPDGTIHRVGVGRFLGTNKGRVDSISERTLSITEFVADGSGCWKTKNIRLMLTQN